MPTWKPEIPLRSVYTTLFAAAVLAAVGRAMEHFVAHQSYLGWSCLTVAAVIVVVAIHHS